MVDLNTVIYVLTYIFEIGSVVGLIFLSFSLYLAQKIKQLFPGGNIVKKWQIMQLLIGVFMVIQVIGLLNIFFPDQNVTYIISGILNLGTGIFIVILFNLSFKTYKLILHKTQPA
ncbi:MAG: hypothetical protein ACFFBP_00535 [Promethearchaeota archaeon]